MSGSEDDPSCGEQATTGKEQPLVSIIKHDLLLHLMGES